MSFDVNRPADNQTIAAGPGDIRENLRALQEDKIVNAEKVLDLTPGNASGNIPVSNGNLCVNLNAEKLGGNLASAFASAGHIHGVVTTSSNGMMSNTDKAKLDGIVDGAEVNQNAFSNVLVGTTTIIADGKTDTLELAAGANIALTPDETNDRVTIAVTGTVPNATAATTATKLATARSISITGDVTGSGNFDGSGNISIPATLVGNAPSASKLSIARTINGVAFDGSANITVTAAANGGTSGACSGNAVSASKLQTARVISLTGEVIGSVVFDGSANVAIITSIPNLVSHGKKRYLTSDTFVVPAGITAVWLTMFAGGGGGMYWEEYESVNGAAYYRPCYATGGRSAGIFAQVVTVSPGESIYVQVGTGGAMGNSGTASAFGSYLTCPGGSGAAKESNGSSGGPREIESGKYGNGGNGKGSGTSGMVLVEW